MGEVRYRQFPDELVAEWCVRRYQLGETITSIANTPGGGLTEPVGRPYVSRIVRGLARPDAPGPKSPSGKREALSAGERDVLFAEVIASEKHFGKPVSLRSLAEKLGRDRFAIKRAATRVIQWVERLLGYIPNGAPDDCYVWTGGIAREKRLLKDGTIRETIVPRFMDGANRRVDPRRFIFEYSNKVKLVPARRLKMLCSNNLCCNYRHMQVSGKSEVVDNEAVI
jgi:hypothetical protein